ncbi:MAG: hypothetical protein ACTSXD_08740 [Candidatus Heimdallarchaeaceae archaeon]
MAKKPMRITGKKGKTKEQVEAKRLEENGASMEDIFYQLPFTLNIGEESFEIKRKNCMESFPIQRRVNNLLQEILKQVGSEKITETIDSLKTGSGGINLEKIIPFISENYSLVSNNVDDILEIFIDEFIDEEDQKKLVNVTIEDFDAAFSDIMRIIFPFFVRPIKRIMSLTNQLTS